MARRTLPDDEIAQHLTHLPGWLHQGDALVQTFVFSGFPQAMEFVNAVAETAEAVQHHPDIDIRYTKVTLRYTTHDSGGITQADINAAASVQGIADAVHG